MDPVALIVILILAFVFGDFCIAVAGACIICTVCAVADYLDSKKSK